jgi:hypothetical protein
MLAATGTKRHKRLIELRRLSMSKVIPLPHRVDAHLPTLSAEGQRAFLIQLIAGWNEPLNARFHLHRRHDQSARGHPRRSGQPNFSRARDVEFVKLQNSPGAASGVRRKPQC